MENSIRLPDGEILTDNRRHTLERGYDHYWRWHENADDWAEWCPHCRYKITHDLYGNPLEVQKGEEN